MPDREAHQLAPALPPVVLLLLPGSGRAGVRQTESIATTQVVRETEAIAFIVAKAVGLETGSASADYVVVAVMLW